MSKIQDLLLPSSTEFRRMRIDASISETQMASNVFNDNSRIMDIRRVENNHKTLSFFEYIKWFMACALKSEVIEQELVREYLRLEPMGKLINTFSGQTQEKVFF